MPKAKRKAAAEPSSLPQTYDLVLRGGRLIDPAQGLDGAYEVGIRRGKIAAVAPKLKTTKDTKTVNLRGAIMTPGLIDTHAHVYQHVSGAFGLDPDMVGVGSGVTCVVDQGGPSALTFDGFREFIVKRAKTRVLAFISTYLAGGLLGHRYVDLYGPTGINVQAIIKAARDNADLVKGIKAHAEPGGYSRWGMDALKMAKEASRELKLPVYVHLGTLWPEKKGVTVDAAKIVDQVVPMLDPGDILAHPFTRYPSGFVGPDGKVHPLVFEAIARGIHIDVGRGSHFSFNNARQVIDAGVLPFTVGADCHGYNIKLRTEGKGYRGVFSEEIDQELDRAIDKSSPFSAPYGLHHAMNELMALGVKLTDVIKMTTCNAATIMGMSDQLGSLKVGMPADISVMRLLEGKWTLEDGDGVQVKTKRMLQPEFVVRGSKMHDADSPLLPELEKAA